jgi:hypothetical protein
MTGMDDLEPLHEDLRDLAERHKVVFEVHPVHAVADGKRVQIGFDVQLYGTHSEAVLEHREPMPEPGCPRCQEVWNHLQELARAVLPPADRESDYRIDGYSGALSFDRKRRARSGFDRPDVELVIEVRHRESYNRPADACEARCVQDMIAALRHLGVQEGSWNEWKAQLFRRDHRPGVDRPL